MKITSADHFMMIRLIDWDQLQFDGPFPATEYFNISERYGMRTASILMEN